MKYVFQRATGWIGNDVGACNGLLEQGVVIECQNKAKRSAGRDMA
jgi:hypothetical protein